MDETKLRRTVEFLHKNFEILGRGGLNAGRSEQDRDLSVSNRVLIDQIGEQKYFDLVQQYEDKTQTGSNPGNPAGNILK